MRRHWVSAINRAKKLILRFLRTATLHRERTALKRQSQVNRIEELQNALNDKKNYEYAFVTTAADRDRLIQENRMLVCRVEELQNSLEEQKKYEHAFVTTAADRDRLVLDNQLLTRRVEGLQRALSKLDLMREKIERDALHTRTLPNNPMPTLFCLGAPKSGTSYIYSILREHSKITVLDKDMHYLMAVKFGGVTATEWRERMGSFYEHATRKDVIRILESYLTPEQLRLYETNIALVSQPNTFLCDFGVSYMSSPFISKIIKNQINKEARLLFCLRNPVSRSYSEYQMRLRHYNPFHKNFVETVSFSEALAFSAHRKETSTYYDSHYAYIENSLYFQRLLPFFEEFSRDQIKVLIFEDEIKMNVPETVIGGFNHEVQRG